MMKATACTEGSGRRANRLMVAVFVLLALPADFELAAAEPRVLVYQRNGKGFVHDNLSASAAAIRELGRQDGFAVDVSSDAAVFNDDALKSYRALIFANSNNEAFETNAQRDAFQRFIRGGGGFVGIHSATGSERQWDYFQQLQGAKFLRHPPIQPFTMTVLDTSHPATTHLGKAWVWQDECYFFTNLNPSIRVLLALDAGTLRNPKGILSPSQQVRGVFPLAWCHEFDGARVFYTALGHKIETYSDPTFRKHLLGGIRWVLGEAPLQQPPPP